MEKQIYPRVFFSAKAFKFADGHAIIIPKQVFEMLKLRTYELVNVKIEGSGIYGTKGRNRFKKKDDKFTSNKEETEGLPTSEDSKV